MSLTNETPRSPLPRLSQRVAWAGALCAALGGVLASSVGSYTASIWVEQGESRTLLREATEFAEELVEEENETASDDSPEEHQHFAAVHGERNLHSILVHELEDVRLPAPRAAARRGGLTFGDSSLPDVPPNKCVRIDAPEPLRVCGSEHAGLRVAVGESVSDEAGRSSSFLWSALIGIVSAAVLAGAGSWLVARWALSPLEHLLRQVRGIRPDNLREPMLAEHETHREIEELRIAIAALVERLGTALNHAQAFASQAAHELRTPLTALCGEVELLLENQANSHELRAVQRRLATLTQLVERLLMLATPGTELARVGRAVDLNDVSEWLFQRLGAESRRVHLTSIDDAIVRGDEELLRSLLKNAVDNALKFSTPRTHPDVHVAISANDKHVLIQVTDQGVGMSESERAHAFTAFYRTPSARASGVAGHGIGLALIAHVATAHGGYARFVDGDAGTCLEMGLPHFR